MKNIEENDKTERVTGLGRRTREEIAKLNQMTALIFQTGGSHQTSLASLRGKEKEVVSVDDDRREAKDVSLGTSVSVKPV